METIIIKILLGTPLVILLLIFINALINSFTLHFLITTLAIIYFTLTVLLALSLIIIL